MSFAQARLHLATMVAKNQTNPIWLVIQRSIDKDEKAAQRRAAFVVPPKREPKKKLVFFAQQGRAFE